MALTPAERQAKYRERKRNGSTLVNGLELTAADKDKLCDDGFAMFHLSEDADHLREAVLMAIRDTRRRGDRDQAEKRNALRG